MSKDEILFNSKYITVKKRDKWYELSSANGSNEMVAVIMRSASGRYLVRYENCPPYYQKGKDKMSMVALTGMKEPNESPLKAVTREILEETGILRKYYIIKYKGWVFSNKQSDLKIHLFIAHEKFTRKLWNKKVFTGIGDGTKGEVGSYAKWISLRTAKTSKCGILKMLLALSWNN